MKRFALFLIASVAALACAQAPAPEVKFSTLPKAVAAGSKLKLTVTVTFADGLHGYQNPPKGEYEIPVTVKIDGKDFKLAKAIYPPGEDATVGGGSEPTKTYAGTIKIPIEVTVPKTVGVKSFKLQVSYQQCNDTACFPPDTVTVPVKVNVVKKVAP